MPSLTDSGIRYYFYFFILLYVIFFILNIKHIIYAKSDMYFELIIDCWCNINMLNIYVLIWLQSIIDCFSAIHALNTEHLLVKSASLRIDTCPLSLHTTLAMVVFMTYKHFWHDNNADYKYEELMTWNNWSTKTPRKKL